MSMWLMVEPSRADREEQHNVASPPHELQKLQPNIIVPKSRKYVMNTQMCLFTPAMIVACCVVSSLSCSFPIARPQQGIGWTDAFTDIPYKCIAV